jgi:exopolysaccharide biosynthesis polyprenyl glycosylphosphotransferase
VVRPGQQGVYRAEVRWERRYVELLVLLDAAAAAIAALVAFVIRFGEIHQTWPNLALTILLPPAWVLTMSLNRAYENRFVGSGSEEFRRVLNAAIRITAVVAVVSYASKAEIARSFVVIAFPLATVLSLVARSVGRGVLLRLRRNGRCQHRVLVVGSAVSVTDLIGFADRDPSAGWQIVGACLTGPARRPGERSDRVGDALLGTRVVGGADDLVSAIRTTRASTVAICPDFDGVSLRQTMWDLEGSDVHVLVGSALTDVTGPRISIKPVAGLPLLHVEEPELAGSRRVLKAAVDRVVALTAVIFAMPLLLVIAVGVRLTSRGPALFTQVRVGRRGQPFRIYKFRSMFADAESRLDALQSMNERSEGLLFKIREDPRVTPLGRFLRRWSLDELPQLLNVLNGTMSLVGPRPPLPSEVAAYEDHVHRRLLVKPGLTGLWQVSGRSTLEWDESVRLDLGYVENWSLALDFVILWRTLAAVLRRQGAY